MPPRIHVVIDVDEAEPTEYTADGFQTAADWLLDELGRESSSPYPPVNDAADLAELVELITDKLGTSGVDVRWSAG